MKCPKCKSVWSRVFDSRYMGAGGEGKKRRRECKHCGFRFVTIEVRVFRDPKRNYRRDKRDKLYLKDVHLEIERLTEENKKE